MRLAATVLLAFWVLTLAACTSPPLVVTPPAKAGFATTTSGPKTPIGTTETRQRFDVFAKQVPVEVSVPPGWGIADEPQGLTVFSHDGELAFNSWGEDEFMVHEVRTGCCSSVFGPETNMAQLPAGGALVILLRDISGMGEVHAQDEPEYPGDDLKGLDLGTLWQTTDCRIGDRLAGVNRAPFVKQKSFFDLQVYCRPDASDETVAQVNSLLESWRFLPTQ